MKRIYLIYLPVLLWTSCGFVVNAQSVEFSKPDSLKTEQIHNSIKHYRYTYNSIPWNINVVEADLTDNRIFISAVKGMERISDSREKLSQIAGRKNGIGREVVAAINADFFYSDGNIVNNQISGGEFVKGISTRRSQFALTYSNKPSIEVYNFDAELSGKNSGKISIDACNSVRGKDSVVIFNHYWGETTRTNGDGIEYELKPIDSIKTNLYFRAIVTAINDSNSTITDNRYILSCSGKKTEGTKTFTIKDTVTISLGFTPKTEPIKELVGGIPHIVKGGINIANEQSILEKASKNILTLRHPRTAIGFNRSKDKLYLVTVDGRQKMSAGMSLNELSEFMIFIGCSETLNLDGGGSTTMIIKNTIVNLPSDQSGERKIGNALLLFTN